MDLLKELQQQTTILYSTHILNDAEAMTDQLLFLKEGVLVEKGSLTEVKETFEEPGYVVEFATEQEALQFVSQSEILATANGKTVLIEVQNGCPTIQQLLNLLAISPFEVRRVERKIASLEEIFLKVVGQ